jgi:hypothetical protein
MMMIMDYNLSTKMPLDLHQGAEKGLDHDGPHRPTTMAINILSIPAISDEPERVFLRIRRTVLWKRAQIKIKNLKKVKCLKH